MEKALLISIYGPLETRSLVFFFPINYRAMGLKAEYHYIILDRSKENGCSKLDQGVFCETMPSLFQ